MRTIIDDAIHLSKVVIRLQEHGYIQPGDGDPELCEYLRKQAVHHAISIQKWRRKPSD